MSSTDKLRIITTQVLKAALAIDPKNPNLESVKLLRKLNNQMEKTMNSLLEEGF